MDSPRVVLDTNILFSALLHRASRIREILLAETGRSFYSPHFVLVELFKHKERIARASQLSEAELLDCLNALLARLRLVEEGVVPIGIWMEARRLCSIVDPKAAPFVALALHVDGRLWTLDSELQGSLRAEGFDRFFHS